MRVALVGVVLVLTACVADDERIPDARSPGDDASALDASTDAAASDGAIDGARSGDGVVCARADQACVEPTPECCDVMTGTDTCVATTEACAGDRLECDGPEDCAVGDECCLFQGQGSRCIQAGVCGTTGAISNEMCHAPTDCAQGEMCCGTAPGPQVDLYAICTMGPCPQ
ncbi:MAG: hypothetical protein K8M05_00100 [Deltaproteobacteria bacterium]|nr:hypothetical protein [Kofleriaceae bacterium]